MGRNIASGDVITPAVVNHVRASLNADMGAFNTNVATYSNLAAPSSVSITKLNSGTYTDLEVNLTVGWRAGTAAPTAAMFGVLINSVDYDIIKYEVTLSALLNAHVSVNGFRSITGLAAGLYTVQVRGRRFSGTGDITIDGTDRISLSVKEVPVP